MLEGRAQDIRRNAIGKQRPDHRRQQLFLHLTRVLVLGGDETAEDGVVGAAAPRNEHSEAGAEILGLRTGSTPDEIDQLVFKIGEPVRTPIRVALCSVAHVSLPSRRIQRTVLSSLLLVDCTIRAGFGQVGQELFGDGSCRIGTKPEAIE